VQLAGERNSILVWTARQHGAAAILVPKILARGAVGINLNATGSIDQPVLQGRLDVKNTFVSHVDFPSASAT